MTFHGNDAMKLFYTLLILWTNKRVLDVDELILLSLMIVLDSIRLKNQKSVTFHGAMP